MGDKDVMKLDKELTEAILSCAEGVFLIEEETHTIVYANEYLEKQHGESPIGKKCYSVLMRRDEPCPFCPPLTEGDKAPYTWDCFDVTEVGWLKIKNRLIRVDGVLYRVGNINAVADMMSLSREAVTEMGELNRLICKCRETKLELEYESTHDRMTHLFNRNQYIRDLSNGERVNSAGVLFFDLNNLKHVNDHYRHAAGDMLLLRLAAALGCAERKEYRAYRIGGDEFVVLCKNVSRKGLEDCLTEIMTKLEDLNRDEELVCSVAVGTAWSDAVCDLEKLTSIADKQMYEDKKRKKAGIST